MVSRKIQLADFINIRQPDVSPEERARRIRHILYIILLTAIAIVLFVWPPKVGAQASPTLDAMDYTLLPGDRVRIELRLSDSPAQPERYSIYDPARIVLDFPGVHLNLADRTLLINTGLAHSVSAVESGGRTRVVIHLVRHAPYKLEMTDGTLYLTIGAAAAGWDWGSLESPGPGHIEDVVFEKDDAGVGRIHVRLSDPLTVITTQEQGNSIIVDFLNTELPRRLHRVYDVTDFATPILTIDMTARGNNTRMVINTTGRHEHLVYQTRNGLMIN